MTCLSDACMWMYEFFFVFMCLCFKRALMHLSNTMETIIQNCLKCICTRIMNITRQYACIMHEFILSYYLHRTWLFICAHQCNNHKSRTHPFHSSTAPSKSQEKHECVDAVNVNGELISSDSGIPDSEFSPPSLSTTDDTTPTTMIASPKTVLEFIKSRERSEEVSIPQFREMSSGREDATGKVLRSLRERVRECMVFFLIIYARVL